MGSYLGGKRRNKFGPMVVESEEEKLVSVMSKLGHEEVGLNSCVMCQLINYHQFELLFHYNKNNSIDKYSYPRIDNYE